MVQDWSDPSTAEQWDQSAINANPLRPEQLDILLTILTNTFQSNQWILDLGYGSGQIEKLIFERIPQAKIVGVDNSDAMMQLAHKRLGTYEHQFVSIKGNLGNFQSLELPPYTYGHVIAIQSLHHLSREQMHAVYKRIYDILEPEGLFLLLDRIRVETSGLWSLYHQIWKRQDSLYGSTVAIHEGDSFQDHERIVQDRGDFPVLLEEHILWIREVGFQAACLHAHGNRALIVGRK
jgi:tRNA (cmo5U34)-methyltransferase